METKSRFEVLSELNTKKEALVREKEGIDLSIMANREAVNKQLKAYEDMKEKADEYEGYAPKRKELLQALINAAQESIDSLKKS